MTDRPTREERAEAAKVTEPCRCVMCADRHGDQSLDPSEREIDSLRAEASRLRSERDKESMLARAEEREACALLSRASTVEGEAIAETIAADIRARK